jgi:hypothetical protein
MKLPTFVSSSLVTGLIVVLANIFSGIATGATQAMQEALTQ